MYFCVIMFNVCYYIGVTNNIYKFKEEMTMIKAEVLSMDDCKKEMHVSVAITGSRSELYTEIRGILKSFNEDPDLTQILIKAMKGLINETMEDN